MLVLTAGINKTGVRLANREDPDQTASSEAVWSGSSLFVYRDFFCVLRGQTFGPIPNGIKVFFPNFDKNPNLQKKKMIGIFIQTPHT